MHELILFPEEENKVKVYCTSFVWKLMDYKRMPVLYCQQRKMYCIEHNDCSI